MAIGRSFGRRIVSTLNLILWLAFLIVLVIAFTPIILNQNPSNFCSLWLGSTQNGVFALVKDRDTLLRDSHQVADGSR